MEGTQWIIGDGRSLLRTKSQCGAHWRYLPTIYHPTRQLSDSFPASRWKRLLEVADIQTHNCGTSQDIEHSLTRTSLASLAPTQCSDRHNEQHYLNLLRAGRYWYLVWRHHVAAVWVRRRSVWRYQEAFFFSSSLVDIFKWAWCHKLEDSVW